MDSNGLRGLLRISPYSLEPKVEGDRLFDNDSCSGQ